MRCIEHDGSCAFQFPECRSKTTSQIRDRLPEAARVLAEVVVDNPLPCAVLFSSTIVVPRLAVRLVRPRGVLEAVALAVLVQAGFTYAAARLTGPGGPLELRVRDQDGIPRPVGQIDADRADPAG